MSDIPAKERPLPSTIENPPVSIPGILSRLGPGLIIAGSIVGSGELIGTTKTGAEAGFWLLWLIIIGCVIKVFVQVELGRDAIVRGKTTMEGFAEVPGPAIQGRGNWLIWYYFLMFAASIGQLGGIVGGVGQALAISMPLTAAGRESNEYRNLDTRRKVAETELALARSKDATGAGSTDRTAILEAQVTALKESLKRWDQAPANPPDDRIWATIVTVATAVLLVLGRYGLIQNVTTAMVALFTLMTVVTVGLLQTTHSWAIAGQDLLDGLSFQLPPPSRDGSSQALGTALKTFGIIGVGASELISYPYWCLEKGYARFTGPADSSTSWAERARGWMMVMRWDAWCSMVIYTLATVAFYLLGAAILGRSGMNPTGNDLIRTLAVMYEPVFGAWAELLFLLGAFAVLYSTFFVANAGHARVLSDAFRVVGLVTGGEKTRHRLVRWLSGLLPFVCLAIYLVLPTTPDQLVLISGMMQALMLPMLSGAALYFRYRRCDRRLTPGVVWDVFLWVSSMGMLVAGFWLAYSEVAGFIAKHMTS